MISRLAKNKFFQDSFIYATGTLFAGFLGYLFHFIISRKLSVSEYGELQSLFALFSILGVLAAALSYFVIKYSSVFAKSGDRGATRKFVRWLNRKTDKFVIIFFFVFLALSPAIYVYLKLSDFFSLIIVGLAVIFSVLTTVYGGVLTGWHDFFSVNAVNVLNAILKLFSGVLIVIFFPKASLVIASLLVGIIFGLFLARFFVREKFFKEEKEETKERELDWQEKYFSGIKIKESVLPIFIFSLMMVLISNIDVVLVKNLTSAEITGYYGVLKVLGLIIITINSAVIAVILPRACAEGHGGKSVNIKILLSAYGLIFLASFSAILLYFFFPEFLINMLFGAKYVVFANDLWLFGIIALILSLLILEANLSYARHDFKISYILAFTAGIMVAGIYIFHQSVREVALSIIASFVLGYLAAFFLNFIHRKTEIQEIVSPIEL